MDPTSDYQEIWLLLGAGISAGPPSNVSLWGEIRQDTQQFLYQTLDFKLQKSGGDNQLAIDAFNHMGDAALPEAILECLIRVYGRTSVAQTLCALLSPPDSTPNLCHQAVAQLCEMGRIAGILTTNFDTLLEDALSQRGVAYRVYNTPSASERGLIPIIKIHGTIQDASSLVFTRNEYYLGLHRKEIEVLQAQMTGSTLVIAGYSGNDIDIFPNIRAMIEERRFDRVLVVNRVPLSSSKRYQPLQHLISYYAMPAEKFLCDLAGIEYSTLHGDRKKRISSVIPQDDKYSAALFFGDSLLTLGLNSNLAFRLFFLTQDIVEEETGDLRQLCISFFAKSYALLEMGENRWGESEYSQGRILLQSLLATSELPAQREMLAEFGESLASLETEEGVKRRYATSGFMSGRAMPAGPMKFNNSPRSNEMLRTVLYWELRARIRLCFAAMAVASNPQCQSQEQERMLQIPQKLMYGFRQWQNFFTERSMVGELSVFPLFYSEFFAAYRGLLLGDVETNKKLESCIEIAKVNGFYIGLAQCFYLKMKFDLSLSELEYQEQVAIQEYCGVKEQSMVAPLLKSGQAFDLSIQDYKPPIKEILNANI